MLKHTVAKATRDGVPQWQISWTEKYPLHEITPIPAPALDGIVTDLQPVRIRSEIVQGQTTHVRFTLSNPSAGSAVGTLSAHGSHLEAEWQDASALGKITLGESGGASVLKHEVSLRGYEEFQITAEVSKAAAGPLELRWQPQAGAVQKATWQIVRDDHDGADLSVTNASLAGMNAFYALRLHHNIVRQGGDPSSPVDLRVIPSMPMRVEILSAKTGQLLAVDANGDGSLDGAGDVLMSDANEDGFMDLAIAGDEEIALLIYPVASASETKREATIEVQMKGPEGWETSAKDLLESGPR